MKVTFLLTTTEGQRPLGAINLAADGTLTIDKAVEKLAAELFARAKSLADRTYAMRDAPRRYDGAYLRAAYEE